MPFVAVPIFTHIMQNFLPSEWIKIFVPSHPSHHDPERCWPPRKCDQKSWDSRFRELTLCNRYRSLQILWRCRVNVLMSISKWWLLFQIPETYACLDAYPRRSTIKSRSNIILLLSLQCDIKSLKSFGVVPVPFQWQKGEVVTQLSYSICWSKIEWLLIGLMNF